MRNISVACTVTIALSLFVMAVSSSHAQDGSKNRFFKGLSTGLEFYQQIEASGGWPSVPAGDTLKPGMSHSRVVALRHRLSVSGDCIGEETNSFDYDEELKLAVTAYQDRNGQEPDGVVGKSTIASLNIPVANRIRQMKINLERWRRMPASLGKKFVLVNMAGLDFVQYRPDIYGRDAKLAKELNL